jgi:succinoglycan biosynthesis protein ExoA
MSNSLSISVVITTFNEGEYLDRILRDLSEQDCAGLEVQVLVLEAGEYPVERAKEHLGNLGSSLVFLALPGMPRTTALNTLVKHAKGLLIVRLDARSHIRSDYLQQISRLSQTTGAENVGGIQSPVGLTSAQQLIADVMRSPLSLGGARFRSASYKGFADSVYLGAFSATKIKFQKWFDEDHPSISEDSDLNYRIRQTGGRVYVDSSIIVEHFPRESVTRFFRLCYNYGIGRGLFVIKHRKFSAVRQLAPPLAATTALTLLLAGFKVPSLHLLLLAGAFTYISIVLWAAVSITKRPSKLLKVMAALMGCHFFWTLGLALSPLQYRRDRAQLVRSTERLLAAPHK